MTEITSAIASYADIKGWFNRIDKFMFDTILSNQPDLTGTLVELGAYLGRSTVVIADHQKRGERFVVVDLFGSDEGLGDGLDDSANRQENKRSYTTLTRAQFEQNFLALHPELPEVIQGLSTRVTEHVDPQSARFIHIDASHMYDKVAEDIANAATLLLPNGVVVLDDYRAAHTPGVAAATWDAVRDGLNPFAITDRKLYATWGDPTPYLETIRPLAHEAGWSVAEQPLREHTIARIFTLKKTAKPKDQGTPAQRTANSRSARLIRDWTPPALARWAAQRRTRSGSA